MDNPQDPATGNPEDPTSTTIETSGTTTANTATATFTPTTTQTPNQKWYDSMSEDMRNNPNIQKFKNAEGMAKSYLELQTLLGHEKVPLPKDENDTLAIQTLNRALGVPDAPEGYEIEEPQNVEGFESMQFGMEQFKQIAHQHNLTPKQAQGIMGEYVSLLQTLKKQSEEAFIAEVNKSKAALTKDWGLAFDSKVKLAQSVMNKFTKNKEEFDHINGLIGKDPIALKWLASVGEQFSEGSLGDLGTPGGGFTKTPSQAKAEYDAIMADDQDIYWAGVRNQKQVQESVRKERVSYVEGLLKQIKAGKG